LESREKVRLIVSAALNKKALDPVVFQTAELTDIADYIVLLTGTSDRHVRTVADAVDEALRKAGQRPLGMEGENEGRWVLIDAVDVIVHVFLEPVRAHYDLERLWLDAPRYIPDVEGMDSSPASSDSQADISR
jgi:ribosome-associated protein